MNLDFSALNDDQLIDLIRAACHEAGQRNLESIARNVMLDESDKIKIAREALEREKGRFVREEAERVAREAIAKERAIKEAASRAAQETKLRETWAWKEEMGARISAVLRPKNTQTLKIWNKSDKRIYIGHGYNDNMVEYYHTGNSYKKPGLLIITKRPGGFAAEEWKAGKEQEVEAQILPLLQEVCEKWNQIELEIPAYAAPQTENQEAA